MAKWAKNSEFLLEISNLYKRDKSWNPKNNKVHIKTGLYKKVLFELKRNLDLFPLGLYKVSKKRCFYKNQEIDFSHSNKFESLDENVLSNDSLLILDSKNKDKNSFYTKIYHCKKYSRKNLDLFIDSIKNKKRIKKEYDVLKEADAGFIIFKTNEYIFLDGLFYSSQLYSLVL